jgi:phage terminase large subunit-like protein
VTKISNDYLIGGRELDLSEFEKIFKEQDDSFLSDISSVVKVNDDKSSKLEEILELTQQIEEVEKYGGFRKWFVPGTIYGIDKLHKHREFLFAGAKYHERYASWSNQTGKTTSAAYELTLHLTGLYPDWWEGRRFSKPISAYAAGSTNETTRNIIQKELIGEVGSLGTGMIPKELILKTTSKTGVSNAVDMLQVKHVSGGTSVLRFKSYDQGRRAFEGEKIDVVWLDEMPDADVYSECYTRTITRNGIIFVTATPLDGMTPLVLSFYATADILPADIPIPSTIEMARHDYQKAKEEAEKKGESFVASGTSKAVIVAGWDDAPWLSEEAKTRILSATPPHLRQARSTGIPGDSGGQVFPTALSEITCDDFPIPAHYKLINAIDPGWNFTGAVFGAIDPDTDTIYIYADYKRGQVEPLIHAEAIKSKSKWKDAPCIFDYAGMGGRSEEQQIKVIFRKHGLKLINADKAVNAGLSEVWERMSTGRLKIFKSCKNLLQEIATYRRNERGDIIKENDHCVDPMRYLCVKSKVARNIMMGSGGPSNPYGQLKGNVSGRRYF